MGTPGIVWGYSWLGHSRDSLSVWALSGIVWGIVRGWGRAILCGWARSRLGEEKSLLQNLTTPHPGTRKHILIILIVRVTIFSIKRLCVFLMLQR